VFGCVRVCVFVCVRACVRAYYEDYKDYIRASNHYIILLITTLSFIIYHSYIMEVQQCHVSWLNAETLSCFQISLTISLIVRAKAGKLTANGGSGGLGLG